MEIKSLLKDCKISRVANSASAATTEVLSSVLDMSGYDSVLFVALLGDVTVNSVLTLTVKQNTASSTSSPTPAATGVATAAWTATGTDADNKVLAAEVVRPTMRYVFASLTRTAANAVVDGIIAIQFNSRSLPQSVDSSIIASAFGIGA